MVSRSQALNLAMDNNIDGARLLQIAVTHTKLALKCSERGVSAEAKESLKTEIEALRIERETIIAKYQYNKSDAANLEYTYALCIMYSVRTFLFYGETAHVKEATTGDSFEECEYCHFDSVEDMNLFLEQLKTNNPNAIAIDITKRKLERKGKEYNDWQISTRGLFDRLKRLK